MTNEDKELLLKDISARLPYRVKGLHRGQVHTIVNMDGCSLYPSIQVNGYCAWFPVETFKPYLRSMESMTEEEKQKYYDLTHQEGDDVWAKCLFDKMVDFCNERHLDYRGLIPMGLALEAPEGMYE